MRRRTAASESACERAWAETAAATIGSRDRASLTSRRSCSWFRTRWVRKSWSERSAARRKRARSAAVAARVSLSPIPAANSAASPSAIQSRSRDSLALPLQLRVAHSLEADDPHGHRWVRREQVAEEALVIGEVPGERVADAEVRGAATDHGRGRLGGLDLLQRAGERERIAGELRAHCVGEILTLAVHGDH